MGSPVSSVVQKPGFILCLLPNISRHPGRGQRGWQLHGLHMLPAPQTPRCPESPRLCEEDPTPMSPKPSSKGWGQTRGHWVHTGSGAELKPNLVVLGSGSCHRAWQCQAGHVAATRHGSAGITCGQRVPGPLPAEPEPRSERKRKQKDPGAAGPWGSQQHTRSSATGSWSCAQGTRPPALLSSRPSLVGPSPSGPHLDTLGCCLLQPQPHIPSLCSVRSVVALGEHAGSLLRTRSWP